VSVEQCIGENRTKIILEYKCGRVEYLKVLPEMKLSIDDIWRRLCKCGNVSLCKLWVPTKEERNKEEGSSISE